LFRQELTPKCLRMIRMTGAAELSLVLIGILIFIASFFKLVH